MRTHNLTIVRTAVARGCAIGSALGTLQFVFRWCRAFVFIRIELREAFMNASRLVVNRRWLCAVALLLAALFVSGVAVTAQGPQPQAALGTGFTYQGQLKNGSAP